MDAYCAEQVSLRRGLEALSLVELAAIGRRVDVHDELTSKARLLAVIPERLQSPTARRRLLGGLAAGEERILFQAAACEKLLGFVGAGPLFRFGPTGPPSALIARALLLPDEATGIYRPPAEVLATVHEEAATKLLGKPTAAPPAPVALDTRSAWRDTVNIWCYVLKNPVALTHRGAPPKRVLAKIMPLLEVAEEDEPLAGLWSAFGSSRLQFLMNDAYRRGALVREERELRAAEWPAGGADTYGTELIAAAVNADSTGAALLATYALALAAGGEWYSAAELAARLRAAGGAENGGAAAAWLGLFVAGFVAAGLAGGGLRLGRAREFEPPETTDAGEPDFLVGANFEVKVAHELSFSARLQLAAFTDQVAGGQLLSFKIDKRSIYRALDAGVDVEEVLRFLAERSSRPLPQNVVFSLRDWASHYGTVTFYEQLVLLAERAEVVEEIANLPKLAPLVRGRRQFHALEIRRKDYGEVRTALIAAGYLPRSLSGEGELAVSPRRLFVGGGNRGTSPARPSLTAAVITFAVEHKRRLKLWLAGERDPVQVTPEGITVRRGEKQLRAEGPNGRTHIPFAAVERAIVT